MRCSHLRTHDTRMLHDAGKNSCYTNTNGANGVRGDTRWRAIASGDVTMGETTAKGPKRALFGGFGKRSNATEQIFASGVQLVVFIV